MSLHLTLHTGERGGMSTSDFTQGLAGKDKHKPYSEMSLLVPSCIGVGEEKVLIFLHSRAPSKGAHGSPLRITDLNETDTCTESQ